MSKYEMIAQYINKNWITYRSMTTSELTEEMNGSFAMNMNVATIHTLMIGIRSTRRYIVEIAKD